MNMMKSFASICDFGLLAMPIWLAGYTSLETKVGILVNITIFIVFFLMFVWRMFQTKYLTLQHSWYFVFLLFFIIIFDRTFWLFQSGLSGIESNSRRIWIVSDPGWAHTLLGDELLSSFLNDNVASLASIFYLSVAMGFIFFALIVIRITQDLSKLSLLHELKMRAPAIIQYLAPIWVMSFSFLIVSSTDLLMIIIIEFTFTVLCIAFLLKWKLERLNSLFAIPISTSILYPSQYASIIWLTSFGTEFIDWEAIVMRHLGIAAAIFLATFIGQSIFSWVRISIKSLGKEDFQRAV